MATDLEKAVVALLRKKPLYDVYWKYYDGEQPIVYSSKKLKDVFNDIDARFTENWCAVVVDAVLERLHINTVMAGENNAMGNDLVALWRDTGLEEDAYAIHECALVTGEAFVIVWPDETSPDAQMQAYFNDSRMVHVEYDPDNPRRKLFGAKWWEDADGHVRLTLYYPERLEYYRTRDRVVDKDSGAIFGAKSFVPFAPDGESDVVENPLGSVPIFHFRTNRRQAKSELVNVVEPQDAINKLLADMMVAAEFGAFKQRWIITNADTSGLKNIPNEIWEIPPAGPGDEPTKLGEFSETDIGLYMNAISKLSADIGVITRTPRHYFYLQQGDPSGEALIAMEAPLNKKVRQRQMIFQSTWRNVLAFMAEVSGRAVPASAIEVIYERAETVQPLTQAQIRQTNKTAGVPLATQLRHEGWTDDEIAKMQADYVREQQLETSWASAALNTNEIESRIRNRTATNVTGTTVN